MELVRGKYFPCCTQVRFCLLYTSSVSANVRTNINTDKITQKKTARYVEPEEWNKEELTAYQFDSEVDMMKYLVSGGMHLYNKNYKGSDRWVKIKVADPGLFMVGVVSKDETKIPVYDCLLYTSRCV